MPVFLQSALLLTASSVFTTFAWHGHLKKLSHSAWSVAAFASWGIALFKYRLPVAANRIGYQTLDMAQLKILQEAVTLSVFVPFAVFFMRQPPKLDYLWAALCVTGAAYFIFRSNRIPC